MAARSGLEAALRVAGAAAARPEQFLRYRRRPRRCGRGRGRGGLLAARGAHLKRRVGGGAAGSRERGVCVCAGCAAGPGRAGREGTPG